jgi:hypothetical protein
MSDDLPALRSPPATMRVKLALHALGLPIGTRWPEAAAALKQRIVVARRCQDDDLAARWSEVKAFLRRNLKNACACGAVIWAQHLRCAMCDAAQRRKP